MGMRRRRRSGQPPLGRRRKPPRPLVGAATNSPSIACLTPGVRSADAVRIAARSVTGRLAAIRDAAYQPMVLLVLQFRDRPAEGAKLSPANALQLGRQIVQLAESLMEPHAAADEMDG